MTERNHLPSACAETESPLRKALLLSDWTSGGAGMACQRLLTGLRQFSKWDASCIAFRGETKSHVSFCNEHQGVLGSFLALVCMRLERSKYRRFAKCIKESIDCRALQRGIAEVAPDLLNIHNLHDVFDFSIARKLPRNIPQIWTLHDMWLLTGGCNYNNECSAWTQRCNADCPQSSILGSVGARARDGWFEREQHFNQDPRRRIMVSPSAWLARMARQRFSKTRVECIPNGIDTAMFRPLDKSHCREVIGLPPDGQIVLAGGIPNGDPRKGGEFLDKALSLLADRESVMVVGFSNSSPLEKTRTKWRIVNPVNGDLIMSLYYNAADIFVLPSLADNLPNTLLESLACGTPCVTFDVGGCPEVVRNGETGCVAKYKDVGDVARCIRELLAVSPERRAVMRARCRSVAENEYGLGLQARRYAELFADLVSQGRRNNT